MNRRAVSRRKKVTFHSSIGLNLPGKNSFATLKFESCWRSFYGAFYDIRILKWNTFGNFLNECDEITKIGTNWCHFNWIGYIFSCVSTKKFFLLPTLEFAPKWVKVIIINQNNSHWKHSFSFQAPLSLIKYFSQFHLIS